jgi:arsenite methyltransferase
MRREARHETGEALVDFLEASSFGNFFRPVPDDLRASFRADLIAAFDSLKGPDGIVTRGWGTALVATRA